MNQTKECCPEFKPENWDNKSFNWQGKQFIKESIPTFFHMPWPPMIGKRITKMVKAAEGAGAMESNKEAVLILFHDPTPFRSEIFLSVTKNVPAAENVTLTGNFEGKVYDGGYKAVPKFIKQMNEYLKQAGKTAKDYYIHYAYCPKCAKKFGHNYQILFAKV